jgi:SAM-dependent methyltransferase
VKTLDTLLQRWRIGKLRPWLPSGMRLLDVGTADGALFRAIPGLVDGVGIDPDLTAGAVPAEVTLVRGNFPNDLPDKRPFDAIAMLAVLEHIPTEFQARLATDCFEYLRSGGLLLITVPGPRVDLILKVLRAARLIDGMSLEQHYGFEPRNTQPIFEAAGLRLEHRSTFQAGLNHLFVFRRP